ncbi:MAG: sigma-70 family RNA polymerase sigma factor [Candidimonas sp.]|jgi:RNA polymerase sigma factor (sigma-70 family)
MSRPSKSVKSWLAHYSELASAWRGKAGGHEDAQDAMHDAVVRLLENGAAAVADPKAYLKRSIANGIIDRHRHRAVLAMSSLDELDESEHPAVSGPEAGVFSRQLMDDLAIALDELPLVCRQVYVGHRLEGWTHAEISAALGISRDMVEKRMTQALQHLNRRLQKYAR